MANGLTATHVNKMLSAAGAGGGLVATPAKIADMFNTAILKYGDGLFTTRERVAALISECMMESAYFRTTTEYTAGRNSYSPYDGRGFIQCTWKTNYAAFGKWCKAKGLLSDADYFVNNPKKLSDLQWAALTGVWYFTHVKFSGKALVEFAGNIDQVGKAVNLGNPYSTATPNGQSARRAAYNAVLSVGAAIVPTPPPAQVKDSGTKDETVTEHIAIHPTANAIHTEFGQWGPSWSWNKGNNKAHPTWGQHGGDDWHRNAGAAEIGDPIYAVADGRVIFAGKSTGSLGWGPAFGNHVLITWDKKIAGDGNVYRTSIDAHMSKTVAKYNQKVKAGDLIGYKGMTGNVSGPHDHHEQHAGQGWGDKRLKPVYPGKTTTKIIEKEGVPVMAKPNVTRRTKDRKFAKSNKWSSLVISDKSDTGYAVAKGPGVVFVAGTIDVDQPCWVRFIAMDWKTGTVKDVQAYPKFHVEPGGHPIYFYHSLFGPAKGYSQRHLRIQICPVSAATTVRDLYLSSGRES